MYRYTSQCCQGEFNQISLLLLEFLSDFLLLRNSLQASKFKTDLVQFVGYSADDGLVSEVEMEPLKVHLPVNPLITMSLNKRAREHVKEAEKNTTYTI